MNLKQWMQEKAKEHNVSIYDIIRSSSFKSRGYIKTGREILWEGNSPFGGSYRIYGKTTKAERSKNIK